MSDATRRRFREKLADRGVAADAGAHGPLRRGGSKSAPLTSAQRRLWFLEQLAPGSCAYNDCYAIRFRGPFDREALESSLGRLVARHDALRTVFETDGGDTTARALEPFEVTCEVEDLSELAAADREGVVRERARAGARVPFDLESGPLVRGGLFRLASDDHVLVLWMHHIVSDGQSFMIFFRELAALYGAASVGRDVALEEIPIAFADFARWESDRAAERAEGHLDYWRRKLAPPLPDTELPLDLARPEVQTYDADGLDWVVEGELVTKLEKCARSERASLFMVVHAVFQIVLAQWTGRDDLLVGSPIATRERAETHGLFGLLVNTIVLRSDLDGDPSFSELVRRTRSACLEAYEHESVPFERLVQELGVERSLGRNPLFQVFVLQDSLPGPEKIPGGEMSHFHADNGLVRADLALWIMDEGGLAGAAESTSLTLRLHYNAALFRQGTVAELLGRTKIAMRAVLDAPDAKLSQVKALLAREASRAAGASKVARKAGAAKSLRAARRAPARTAPGEGE